VIAAGKTAEDFKQKSGDADEDDDRDDDDQLSQKTITGIGYSDDCSSITIAIADEDPIAPDLAKRLPADIAGVFGKVKPAHARRDTLLSVSRRGRLCQAKS
jgi:hypothetical protein